MVGTGLADAATYTYRVRARRILSGATVVGDWSETVSSTQDDSGPLVTLTDPVSLATTQS